MSPREVFSHDHPTPWTPAFAVIGGRPSTSIEGDVNEEESEAEIAFAFRHAAQLITKDWHDNDRDDSLILVVLYSYRHALELQLKAVVKALLASWRFEEPSGELSEEMQQIRRRARGKHVLTVLVEDLTKLVRLFNMPLRDDVRAVCEKIHALDPDGQRFRWPTIPIPHSQGWQHRHAGASSSRLRRCSRASPAGRRSIRRP